MKRSTKRLIYFQILLLGANGIYTMLVDKPMKLMMFATGPIYKSSGTASEKNKDESYSSASDRERIGRRRSREKRARAMVCQRDSAPPSRDSCNREGLYNLPTFFFLLYIFNTSFIFFLLLLWLLLLFYYTVYLLLLIII